MHASTILATLTSVLALAAAAPSRLTARQDQSTETVENTNIGLYVTDADFDINYLYTFRVLYANTSAYLGAIKYQSYSEPLIVGNFTGDENSVSFLSIHSSPTGYQQMYLFPDQSKPLGFSVPHGGAPEGVITSGYSFSADGALLNGGVNKFYACQDPALNDLNSYQIYWLGAGYPDDVACQGPIKIIADDACTRY